jgi:hypothetical protein
LARGEEQNAPRSYSGLRPEFIAYEVNHGSARRQPVGQSIGDRFLGVVSHELKNRDPSRRFLPDRTKRYATTLRCEAQRLLELAFVQKPSRSGVPIKCRI